MVLASWKDEFIPTQIPDKGVNLLSMSQFLEELEEKAMVYASMPCEEGARGDGDVLVELQEMLPEFDGFI